MFYSLLFGEHKSKINMPRNLQDVYNISEIFLSFQQTNYLIVLLDFCLIFIFIQTFCIPGSACLVIVAGRIFGVYFGLFIVLICSTIGSTNCYYVSKLFGRPIIFYFFKDKYEDFAKKIEENRNVFLYLLSLRIMPICPNMFVNIFSPLINVKVIDFVIATFIGIIPICTSLIYLGYTLENVDLTSGNFVGYDIMIVLFILSFLSLLPTFMRKREERKAMKNI
eukprot:TRINITY_DN4494_c0_g1_i1.p1 TRINITY_DN4494_c0_g1~~TRINITY_DN4494_c0_g1_i1.p1  ORF type:complete len:223 (-),score=23.92 TRINITY_DN4494_c0_g1_i1:26-694(-)